jgi:ribosomal protein L37E
VTHWAEHMPCRRCGYDLYGSERPVCPECGTVDPEPRRKHRRGRQGLYTIITGVLGSVVSGGITWLILSAYLGPSTGREYSGFGWVYGFPILCIATLGGGYVGARLGGDLDRKRYGSASRKGHRRPGSKSE